MKIKGLPDIRLQSFFRASSTKVSASPRFLNLEKCNRQMPIYPFAHRIKRQVFFFSKGRDSLLNSQLREVYIRVPKLYDWVLTTSYARTPVTVPPKYRSLVHEAINAGKRISVQCITQNEPCSPAAVACQVHSPIRRTTILHKGNPVPMGIVQLSFQTPLNLLFFADCDLLFDFMHPLELEDELVLCVPEPLDQESIVCRIADFECTAQTGYLFDDKIMLHVFVCHELLVEAKSVLEIMAQACKPRPNFLTAPPRLLPLHCTPFSPPPACPRLQVQT